METLPIAAALDAGTTELVVLGILAAAAALVVAAQFLRLPYPIMLVLFGLALGFTPGVPNVTLPPDLVLVIVLPPLLYAAAFFSSLRDLRANVRPISLLALGLVTVTMLGVAVVAHAFIDGLSWGAAFVLGAVVSPTDPIAATSIARRLGVPRRVVTIVEGESLVNDATALVLYRFAVAAVLTGTFSFWEAAGEFVLSVVGGLAIGLAVGWIVAWIRRRLDDPPTEIAVSLMTAYLAYLPAVALDVSGVVAAVTVGIYMGWHTPELVTPTVRLQGFAVWEVLVFVLNALVFTLLGLQFESVIDGIEGESAATLLAYGLLTSVSVVVIRLLWVFPLTYLPRRLLGKVRRQDPGSPWHEPLLVGWSGMRGAVSLAAALAIPLETDAGAPFPDRDLIIFLTFCVILFTLVLQGLSLPPLIRRLPIPDDPEPDHEENHARLRAAQAALARLDELASEDWARDDTVERLRTTHRYRKRRFAERHHGEGDGEIEERSRNYQRIQRELLEAQRAAVIELRRQGVISDQVMRRIERDLDLEDSRLEI
ncbi:MAG: Na+/H+ antiporter [Solirubrobacterales bacterium]